MRQPGGTTVSDAAEITKVHQGGPIAVDNDDRAILDQAQAMGDRIGISHRANAVEVVGSILDSQEIAARMAHRCDHRVVCRDVIDDCPEDRVARHKRVRQTGCRIAGGNRSFRVYERVFPDQKGKWSFIPCQRAEGRIEGFLCCIGVLGNLSMGNFQQVEELSSDPPHHRVLGFVVGSWESA